MENFAFQGGQLYGLNPATGQWAQVYQVKEPDPFGIQGGDFLSQMQWTFDNTGVPVTEGQAPGTLSQLAGVAALGGLGFLGFQGGLAGLEALGGGGGAAAGAAGAAESAAAGGTAAAGSAAAETPFLGGLTGTATGAPGFTGAATGAPGFAAGAGATGTALAPGFFAAESLYPVLGGGAAAAGANSLGSASSGTGTAAPVRTAAGGTALSNLTGIDPGILSLLGIAGATGLGIYGSGQQSDALRDIASQGRADRAPFLAKANEYLTNPDAYLAGPGQSSIDAVLRGLSVKGNPAGMPSSMALAGDYGLRSWLNATTGLANLGLAGEDTRANLMSQATGADANALNSLGWGLGQVTNPPQSLEQLLRQINRSGTSLV